jgi:arabinofuranosyltransferase
VRRAYGLTFLPALALLVLGWSRRWMSDDGFINIRVVENLFAGHGPVFNVGERVEVGTSTLWLVVLAVGHVVAPFTEIRLVAVYAGLLASAAGLALATWGSLLVARVREQGEVALPLGGLVVAALPPFWDFATSGLETGLSFLWLGGCFALLARRWTRREGAPLRAAYRAPWTAFVIGLSPLVRRPDAARRCAGRRAAAPVAARGPQLAGCGRRRPRRTAVVRGVPGGLLRRARAEHRAGEERRLVAVGRRPDVRDRLRRHVRAGRAARAARGGLGAAGAARQTRPLAARAAGPAGRRRAAARAVRGPGWRRLHARALPAAGHVRGLHAGRRRVGSPRAAGGPGCADRHRPRVGRRRGYVTASGVPRPGRVDRHRGRARRLRDRAGVAHPIRIEDFGRDLWYHRGLQPRAEAASGARRFVYLDFGPRPAAEGQYVLRYPNLGILGVAAGDRVLVADSLSPADPIGARLVLPPPAHPRIGHSQVVPPVWHRARYAAPAGDDGQAARAARAALFCGALRELVEATGAPLTPRRFLRNLLGSVGRTSLRLPGDPVRAAEELCR